MALTDQQQQDLYNRIIGHIPDRPAPDGKPGHVLDSADGNYIVGLLNGVSKKADDLKVQNAALSTAVEALAASVGADPATVAGIVDKAVRDRLAQIVISDTPAAGV